MGSLVYTERVRETKRRTIMTFRIATILIRASQLGLVSFVTVGMYFAGQA